jgi:hypothetical protein
LALAVLVDLLLLQLILDRVQMAVVQFLTQSHLLAVVVAEAAIKMEEMVVLVVVVDKYLLAQLPQGMVTLLL